MIEGLHGSSPGDASTAQSESGGAACFEQARSTGPGWTLVAVEVDRGRGLAMTGAALPGQRGSGRWPVPSRRRPSRRGSSCTHSARPAGSAACDRVVWTQSCRLHLATASPETACAHTLPSTCSRQHACCLSSGQAMGCAAEAVCVSRAGQPLHARPPEHAAAWCNGRSCTAAALLGPARPLGRCCVSPHRLPAASTSTAAGTFDSVSVRLPTAASSHRQHPAKQGCQPQASCCASTKRCCRAEILRRSRPIASTVFCLGR